MSLLHSVALPRGTVSHYYYTLLQRCCVLVCTVVHTAQGPPAARVVIWADVEAAAKKAVGADVAARVS